ncbi:flavin reductase family protein [Bacillus gobiensis]|uniref:flavin reductase family protein n=1 Tax=Bacillus gobiensis TaxID=1441095 RepID=UPI003D24A512
MEKSLPVHLDTFKQAMGRLATGVSVITSKDQDYNFGLTASSVTSLTAEPPMLLVCIHQKTGTREAIVNSGHFAVHILHEHQSELALQFANSSTDKFAGLDIIYGKHGIPLLQDYFVRIECQAVHEAKAGTHSIFMGEIHQVEIQEKRPLLHFKSEFGKFVSAK